MSFEAVEVLSTHVTTVHQPGTLVAEIEPGIFVIDGRGVMSEDIAGYLFSQQAAGDRRPFTVTPRQLLRVSRIAESRKV